MTSDYRCHAHIWMRTMQQARPRQAHTHVLSLFTNRVLLQLHTLIRTISYSIRVDRGAEHTGLFLDLRTGPRIRENVIYTPVLPLSLPRMKHFYHSPVESYDRQVQQRAAVRSLPKLYSCSGGILNGLRLLDTTDDPTSTPSAFTGREAGQRHTRAL